MKKILPIFAILPLIFLLGCDFDKDTYASLESAEALYVAVYDATEEAKKDKLITQEQVNIIADALDIYEGSFTTARIAYQIWKQEKTDTAKSDVVYRLEQVMRDRQALFNAFVSITKGIEGVKSWKELQPN